MPEPAGTAGFPTMPARAADFMSLFTSAVASSRSDFVASAELTSLTVLQALSSAGLPLTYQTAAPAAQHDALLRETLTPLRTQAEYVSNLALETEVHEELGHFLDTDEHEPSQALLTALHGKARVLHGILSGSTTGSLKRERIPLQYDELSETAHQHHDVALREAVDRMLARIHEGTRTSQAGVPKAISLSEILEHPENFRGGKPLEIVLFDVDGTTHLGETFAEGQYSIEWLMRDILRYGPKATAGLSWWKIIKALPGIIKLRLQEKRNGKADKDKFNATIGPLLKGLDGHLAEESIRRYYQRYGSRGVSQFMKDEFSRHRQEGRLIIGVSASHEFLVKLHAEKDLSIPTENMLGTTIEIDPNTNKATGKFRWLHGEEKVAAMEERVFGLLREKGVPFRVVGGYSDSPSDKPMLERVREDGGIVYATNTSKDDFKSWALENGGMSVDEWDGWWSKGSRKVTIFSSLQAGELSHMRETAPHRPEWVNDLGRYAVRTLSDGLGIALAAPVSQAAHQALAHGHVDWSSGLLASAPTMAVAGMIMSAATAVLVPEDGPVSWQRRVMARGALPVTAALVAAGAAGPYGLTAALATAAVACAGAELVTAGERMTGLRRWKGGDERKNPIGKTIGFAALRAIQFAGFQALMYGIQYLFSR